jgi:hypothetical protein
VRSRRPERTPRASAHTSLELGRTQVKERRRDALLRKLFGLYEATRVSSASTLPPPIAFHTANDGHACPRASQVDTRVEGTGGHARRGAFKIFENDRSSNNSRLHPTLTELRCPGRMMAWARSPTVRSSSFFTA